MGRIKKVQQYLDWRHEFLTQEQQKNNGVLECVYCGEKELEIGYQDIKDSQKNERNPKLATVDHIVPGIKGIDRMNVNIAVVSCRKCNQNKKDLDPKTLPPPKYGNIDKVKQSYFMDMTSCISGCKYAHPTLNKESPVRYCKLLKKRLKTIEGIIIKLNCDEARTEM